MNSHHHQHQRGQFYQHHGGSEYGGESHFQDGPRHFPQHYQHPSGRPQWNSASGKRQRGDSPTPSDGDPAWQASFKRLKVVDDSSSTTDSLYSTITNYSSTDYSRFDGMAPHLKDELSGALGQPSLHGSCHRQVTTDYSSVQQSAGERSCEPSTGYYSMNSVLGNLHLMRLQRAGVGQPAAQHPAPAMDPQHQSSIMGHATMERGTIPHKKPVSLRTRSKLY